MTREGGTKNQTLVYVSLVDGTGWFHVSVRDVFLADFLSYPDFLLRITLGLS